MKLLKNKRDNSVNVVIFFAEAALDMVAQKLIEKKKYGVYCERYITDVKRIYVHIKADENSTNISIQEQVRKDVAKLVDVCKEEKVTNIDIDVKCGEYSEQLLGSVVDGLYFGAYNFDYYKSEKKRPELNVTINGDYDLSLYINMNIAQNVARNLVNTPGSDLTPEIYANRVKEIFLVDLENWLPKGSKFAKEEKVVTYPSQSGYGVYQPTVYHISTDDGTIRMEFFGSSILVDALGYNGIHTVGKGSDNSGVMVELRWLPKSEKLASSDHHVFVGKGVTFDTGGISLKPDDGMWEMKMDMGGSATALGAFIATVLGGSTTKTSAILCLAENRPGNGSVLPGDIFTAANGKTVMVDNTDAEGRLVLTDGLYHAGKIGATHIIDIATLTGAVIGAIGPKMAGVFSDDIEMVKSIIEIGDYHGEKYWQLPLLSEYRENLDDDLADICNMGGKPGATTAALFLKEFVPEGVKWMHLDIAGPGIVDKNWKYYGKGGSGFGVKPLFMLPEFLSGMTK